LKTEKIANTKSLSRCHLRVFGHRTGHAQLFIIAPRLAGAIVASEAKQTKNKRNSRSNGTVCACVVFWI
jgi:hypothetical protein